MTGLRLEAVARKFGDDCAVDRIDLSVSQGEFLTLLGPSGCGKTTTLRMIAGLDRSDGGRILLGNRVVDDRMSGTFVAPERRAIGMVFQSYAIWPHLSVFDNVAYPLVVRRRPRAEIETRVMNALRLVGLEAFAASPAPALSGGQQQRVAIARAIVFEPGLLLMDEPLSNLDARLREAMQIELRTLQQRLGITTVYVTHDQQEAMALSDRIIVMGAGRILQQGQPEQIYFKPASATVATFLGAPNLLDATVTASRSAADGLYQSDLDRPGWRGSAATPSAFAAGTRVKLVVRPERVRLSRSNAADASWCGTILQSTFRGARRSYVIRCGEDLIHADTDSACDFKSGEKVAVTLDASSLWAIGS